MDSGTVDRFWEKVNKTDACWLWTAGKRSKGYGAFVWRDGDRTIQGRAHRFSWELHYGAIPVGLWVLHSCDTPACVRPSHLFLGDAQANVDDMVRKGRHVNGGQKTPAPLCHYRRGTSHHAAKLTPSVVRRLRADRAAGMSFSRLATAYGIAIGHVFRIASRRAWAHVE